MDKKEKRREDITDLLDRVKNFKPLQAIIYKKRFDRYFGNAKELEKLRDLLDNEVKNYPSDWVDPENRKYGFPTEEKDFFISRTSADKKSAKWVARTLEKHGYTTIIQDWDFGKGDGWVAKAHEGLKNSKWTIAIWSKNYVKSEACNNEWQATFANQCNSKTVKLLIIRIDNTKVDGILSSLIYHDVKSLNKKGEKALIDFISGCSERK